MVRMYTTNRIVNHLTLPKASLHQFSILSYQNMTLFIYCEKVEENDTALYTLALEYLLEPEEYFRSPEQRQPWVSLSLYLQLS